MLGYNCKRDFTTLVAWKKARLIKIFFYKDVIPCLPIEERFCLNVQIRRAAISATANISERYGRYHIKRASSCTVLQEAQYMS
jgi:four helix bundle protein